MGKHGRASAAPDAPVINLYFSLLAIVDLEFPESTSIATWDCICLEFLHDKSGGYV